jgi:hypothetical protein
MQLGRVAKEIRVPVPERIRRRRSSRERVAESGLSARSPRKVRYFLAVSQTSASASPENNRQPEQDDCDRHKRRAGDVSDQDEEGHVISSGKLSKNIALFTHKQNFLIWLVYYSPQVKSEQFVR